MSKEFEWEDKPRNSFPISPHQKSFNQTSNIHKQVNALNAMLTVSVFVISRILMLGTSE